MKKIVLATGVMFAFTAAWSIRAQQPTDDGPRYVNGTNLVRPANYREWVFLGSSVGMTYAPPTPQSQASPNFGNVFVNPSSYRSFMQTGKWPDRTIFVLEPRRSSGEGAIIQGGRFQTDLLSLEAEVKDAQFPDGWAFFNFGSARALKDSVEPTPPNAASPGEMSCVECHTKHTAVERTFVQFYPTLLEVARRMGTVKPGY
jgi:hypothetical protein